MSQVNVNPPSQPSGAGVRALEPGTPAWGVGKVNQILWFIAAVLEALLGLRFLLRLLGASPTSAFGAFLYAVTYPFIWPFEGLLGNPGLREGPVLEVITLAAMLVYFLCFLALTQLLRLLISRPHEAV